MLGSSHLDLHKLYALIKDNGGMDRVTQEMKWRSISLQMGLTPEATPSTTIRMAYKKHLYGFEMFEKGKGKPTKDTPLRRKSTNMACEMTGESDEDGEEEKPPPPKVEEKQPSKGVEEKQTTPTTAKPSRKLPKENSRASLQGDKNDKVEKVDKLSESDRMTDEKTGVDKSEEMVPLGTPKVDMGTPKGEKRVSELDSDDLQLESSSSNGDDAEERHIPMLVEGVEPSKTGYEEGNRVLIWYGKGKQQLTYEAKIIGVDKVVESDHKEYLVHYSGWNTRYDEWVDESRIAGKLSSPSSSSSKGTTRLTQKAKNQTPSGGNGRKTRGKDPTGTADSPQMEKKESSVSKDSGTVSTSPHAPVAVTSSPIAPVATPAAVSHVTTPSVPVITPSVPVTTPSIPTGTPNTVGSGKPAKGRGGRRRKISSSVDSSDCNSPSTLAVAVEEAVDTALRVASKVGEVKPASTGEAKTITNIERLEGANGLGTCCPEQARGSEEESCHGGCGPVESCSEEPTNGRSAGRSPSVVPAGRSPVVEEIPTLPKEAVSKVKLEEVSKVKLEEVSKVKLEEVSKVKLEEVKEDEVCERGGDGGKKEIEERKEEESKQVKLVVDDEVFNDDLEEDEEEEGDMEMEQGRDSSSNSSIHPDPVGSSPPMSDTNSPGDLRHPPLSPNKQEDHSEEGLDSDKSQSEKGVSPAPAINTKRASCTPERKRKWKHLTLEEYEERVKARREELNFSIDASSLIHMSTGERIQIIQERIRELQKRWQDLKAEVTYLDRRKRTARRKKEG
eukprot:Em0019g249a